MNGVPSSTGSPPPAYPGYSVSPSADLAAAVAGLQNNPAQAAIAAPSPKKTLADEVNRLISGGKMDEAILFRVQELTQTGGKIDERDGTGFPPFVYAAYQCRFKLAAALVNEYKADPKSLRSWYNQNALHAAISGFDSKTPLGDLHLLTEVGVSLIDRDKDGLTPFMVVLTVPIENGLLITFFLKTKDKSHLTLRDPKENTVLHLAAANLPLPLFAKFLHLRELFETTNASGHTPMRSALQSKKDGYEKALLLLGAGAKDPKLETYLGAVPLTDEQKERLRKTASALEPQEEQKDPK